MDSGSPGFGLLDGFIPSFDPLLFFFSLESGLGCLCNGEEDGAGRQVDDFRGMSSRRNNIILLDASACEYFVAS